MVNTTLKDRSSTCSLVPALRFSTELHTRQAVVLLRLDLRKTSTETSSHAQRALRVHRCLSVLQTRDTSLARVSSDTLRRLLRRHARLTARRRLRLSAALSGRTATERLDVLQRSPATRNASKLTNPKFVTNKSSN